MMYAELSNLVMLLCCAKIDTKFNSKNNRNFYTFESRLGLGFSSVIVSDDEIVDTMVTACSYLSHCVE
jgi:hypothetical protein